MEMEKLLKVLDGFRLDVEKARELEARRRFGMTALGIWPAAYVDTYVDGYMCGCQRQSEIVRKRRRNFVVFRRAGGNKIKHLLAGKES